MTEKMEREFELLFEVYSEELYEIAVMQDGLEGVCHCEEDCGCKHFDFDFHEELETLFLFALREGNLFQFDMLLMLNDTLLSVDMEDEEEVEEGYIDLLKPVTVICRLHGPFSVIAQNHLDGEGCPICDRMSK